MELVRLFRRHAQRSFVLPGADGLNHAELLRAGESILPTASAQQWQNAGIEDATDARFFWRTTAEFRAWHEDLSEADLAVTVAVWMRLRQQSEAILAMHTSQIVENVKRPRSASLSVASVQQTLQETSGRRQHSSVFAVSSSREHVHNSTSDAQRVLVTSSGKPVL